jgi:hypothetical protein
MEGFQASNCNSDSMFCGDIYSSSLIYTCSLLNITGVKLNKHPNYQRWLFYTSKSFPIVTTFKSISVKIYFSPIYFSPVLCDILVSLHFLLISHHATSSQGTLSCPVSFGTNRFSIGVKAILKAFVAHSITMQYLCSIELITYN